MTASAALAYHRRMERLRFYLGTKGYLQAKVGEPEVVRAGEVSGGIPLPIPLLHKKGPGLKITVPLEIACGS